MRAMLSFSSHAALSGTVKIMRGSPNSVIACAAASNAAVSFAAMYPVGLRAKLAPRPVWSASSSCSTATVSRAQAEVRVPCPSQTNGASLVAGSAVYRARSTRSTSNPPRSSASRLSAPSPLITRPLCAGSTWPVRSR